MPNDSPPRSPWNVVRWIFTGVLVVIAVAVTVTIFRAQAQASGPERLGAVLANFVWLDILTFIGLAVWILRPPVPGDSRWLGQWVGKVALLLGLWVATVVFLFVTCLHVT